MQGGVFGKRARLDVEVITRGDSRIILAEGFANEAFEAIAIMSFSEATSNSDPKPSIIWVILTAVDDNPLANFMKALMIHALVVVSLT